MLRWPFMISGLVVSAALFACTLIYYFYIQPTSAELVAKHLGDTADVLRANLEAAGDEQLTNLDSRLMGLPDYALVPDAAMTEQLAAPDTQWFRLVAHRLTQLSDGKLSLKRSTDTGQFWLNVDTDQTRYWLKIPPDRLSGADFPLLLPLDVAVIALLLLFSAWVILNRLRKVTQLLKVADELQQGKKPAPLPDVGPPELEDLGRAINKVMARIQQSESENRLLLGGISHDLRTPLTSLRLGLELSKDRLEPGLAKSLGEDIEEIETILLQFLDYARDDSEEPVGTGDINDLIKDMCGRLEDVHNPIETNLASIPQFQYRPLAMHRLIRNLLQNALTHGQSTVSVATYLASDGRVAIAVRDRGPGIDVSQLEIIRRPFVRGTQSRNGHSGSGLGLSIVERIAELHGGLLYLDNRQEGGLEARVELPLRSTR